MKIAVAASAAVLLAAGAALAGSRVLPFAPLEHAKPGDAVLFKLEIFDATSRPVSKTEKRYTVDSRELGTVRVGKLELPEKADAAEIIGAMGLVPPGTPFEGVTAKAEAISWGRYDQKIETIRVSLRAKLKDAPASVTTSVVFDGWFSKDIPVFGLVRSRTRIIGGGAGESAYELLDFKRN